MKFNIRNTHVEIICEKIRDIGTDVQGVLHVFLLVGCRVNSELSSVPLRVFLRKLEIANYEAGEIRHHRHALLERHLGKPGSG